MPELPEVETVRLSLKAQLLNVEIEEVTIYYSKIISSSASLFKERIKHQHFREFYRRGKYLLFLLDDYYLVCHLRMEGKFYYFKQAPVIDKHTHLLFKLSNGAYLAYHDVRKFGRLDLLNRDIDIVNFANLGPEPFSSEFSIHYISKQFKHLNKPIKEVLLDQHFVAGIGNIYADEVLFKAQIHPLTRASYLNDIEIFKLKKAIIEILTRAIKAGGTTIRSFTSQLGISGRFQRQLAIYGRVNSPCFNCSNIIKKIKVGGRGTHFCPTCQKQKLRIAISGSLGSGKSSALKILEKSGYSIFDCDKENAALLENEGVIASIKNICPVAIKKEIKKEKIDKRVLSDVLFTNKKIRLKIEKLLHNLLLRKIEECSKNVTLLIVEVPLLFEARWQKYFDHNLLITTKEKLANQRLKLKGYTSLEISRRRSVQLSQEEKIKLAEDVLENNESQDALEERILKWVKKYDC